MPDRATRRPISQEGFTKLVSDVMGELTDIELEHALERVGLPPGPLKSFAHRVGASMEYDGHDEGRHIWEAIIIGVLLGSKAEEWKNSARAD